VGDMSKRVNVGEYFEARLQIRPVDKKVLEFVLKRVKPIRVINYKFGFDIFFRDKKEAFNISKDLKKEFKGEVKATKTIFGGGKGNKIIYRHTFLFRRDDKD